MSVARQSLSPSAEPGRAALGWWRGAAVRASGIAALALAGILTHLYPHEICPVDGVIIDGHGVMDESYLTGEPFMMPKAPGPEVFSGAINGEKEMRVLP